MKDGQVFWDLGCGNGKAVALAALLYPKLAAAKGVEYLPLLTQSAK